MLAEINGFLTFLNTLDKNKLLTRQEERVLAKNIEKYQYLILEECAKYSFFREEVITVLSKSESLPNLNRITRLISDKNCEKQYKKANSSRKKLMRALKKNKDYDTVRTAIEDFKFSGNMVHKMVTDVKRKVGTVKSYREVLSRLLKFFECEGEGELHVLIDELKTDKDKFKKFARENYIRPQRLIERLRDFEDYISQKEKVRVLELEELTKAFKKIDEFERAVESYRAELVSRNLRLVVSRAKRQKDKLMDFEDMVQEGTIGLVRAIDKYDCSRNTRISTFATYWIDQAIQRAITNKAKTVRIPTHVAYQQQKLNNIYVELTQELGRPPTKAEVALRADVSEEFLEKLDSVAMHEVGIDQDLGSGVSLNSILAADSSYDPFERTSKELIKERIRKILSTLDPRSEKILRLRFGLGVPEEGLTLQQIADKFGITRMGVHKIQTEALNVLAFENRDLKKE